MSREHRTSRLLFLVFVFVYGYFFQGGGWNQNSQLALVRAIAEHGTFEISRYASTTGDTSSLDGQIFSNKAPGLALLGSGPYFLFVTIERAIGVNPTSIKMLTLNTHLLCLLLGALPAAACVVLIYRILQGRDHSQRSASLLAVLFGLGTMVFPYSGALMSSNLTMAGLFFGWYYLFLTHSKENALQNGAAALALALLSDYSAVPISVALLLIRCISGPPVPLRPLLSAPLLALVLCCIYSKMCFGSFFTTSYAHTNELFLRDDLIFLGLFGLPRLDRLIGLTISPEKGLFVISPYLVFALYPLVKLKRGCGFSAAILAAAGICMYFFLLAASMRTWTAGWGIGPRYLIPALPFLHLFACEALRRSGALFVLLGVYSAGLHFAVSAAGTFIPTPLEINSTNGEEAWTPFGWAVYWLKNGDVSINTQSIVESFPSTLFPAAGTDIWDSYNVGELIGLQGLWSLLPLLLVLAVFVVRLSVRKA